MAHPEDSYYLPHGTRWPILGSIGMFTLVGGFAALLTGSGAGGTLMVTSPSTFGVLTEAPKMASR